MPDHTGPGDRNQQSHAHPIPPDTPDEHLRSGDTVVSAGTAAALLLGLLALTGSLLALGIASAAAVSAWLLSTDDDADHGDRATAGPSRPPFGPRPPFGGPSGWL